MRSVFGIDFAIFPCHDDQKMPAGIDCPGLTFISWMHMPELQISCLTTRPSQPRGIDTIQCLFPDQQITVRNLIVLAVREQCRQLEKRHRANLNEARAELTRQYLSEREVVELAATGRVALNQNQDLGNTELDPDKEIAKALKGFHSKSFMILVGSHRCTALDETVTLALTQPVQFIRMIPLAGG
jgi:hypothetical protein